MLHMCTFFHVPMKYCLDITKTCALQNIENNGQITLRLIKFDKIFKHSVK